MIIMACDCLHGLKGIHGSLPTHLVITSFPCLPRMLPVFMISWGPSCWMVSLAWGVPVCWREDRSEEGRAGAVMKGIASCPQWPPPLQVPARAASSADSLALLAWLIPLLSRTDSDISCLWKTSQPSPAASPGLEDSLLFAFFLPVRISTPSCQPLPFPAQQEPQCFTKV